MTKNDDIVIFKMPDGTEFSNDPRWISEKARERMVQQMGLQPVPVTQSGDTESDEDDENNPELPPGSPKVGSGFSQTDSSGVDEDEEDEGPDYESKSAGEVKDLLQERINAGRPIDATGVTKKSQAIELLRADDEAQAQEADNS